MEFFNQIISKAVFLLAQQSSAFWQSFAYSNISWWQAFIDILLVAVVVYYLFTLVRGTRAVNILMGLIILSVVFIISKSLQLLTLGWLLDRFLTVVLVAIPVIFQQELRMGLEKLGHTPFSSTEKNSDDAIIPAIVEACDYLSRNKTGALIVIQHGIALKEYIETGVKMESSISKELLINIFYGRGPLHDGAVIIDKQKIIAAACVLPNSFGTTNKNLGTRHKAAIGLSEHTDATVIVVSEEKGILSFAKNGRLEKDITPARLQQLLKIVLKPSNKTKKKQLKYKET